MTVSRIAIAAAVMLAGSAQAQTLRPDQQRFHDLYKQLVETNTTMSAGSCTLAAAQVAERMKAAGYTDAELTPFSVPEHPKEGGLVAVLPGTDPKAKAILLLAHIDVVEAKREDWTRDPFVLVEENGYFYARGASDDKAMAAIYADTMIRLKSEKRPRRTVKMALTCGEETNGAFNGAEYLAANKRDLIDAGFALNEGGGGRMSKDGKPEALALQVSEKISQNYTLTATNPGGHSSMPRPDNAIYQIADAVAKIEAYHFPVVLDGTTTAFFTRAQAIMPPPVAAAMKAIVANPRDAQAEAILSRDPTLNSTLRTTCVVTLIDGGHAENALPQRSHANVNCRIFPTETVEATQARLAEVIADPRVTITAKARRGPVSKPTPLTSEVLAPAEAQAKVSYPGLPIIPTMSTGASDAIFLAAVGIPTYGVPGVLYESDGGGIHGLNERIRVKSVYDGRDYLHALVRRYAEAK